MNDKILYRAKSYVVNETPLYHDCGRLCNHRCCHGDDKTGMELFPGEFEMENLQQCGALHGNIFVCHGQCDRKHRPYACMIFPLFPLLAKEEDGRLKVHLHFDVRARSLCPLTFAQLRPDFIRSVRRSVLVLCEDADYRSCLLESSEKMRDAIRLNSMLNLPDLCSF